MGLLSFTSSSTAAAALAPVVELPGDRAGGFGMVIRDPFYEWNRDDLYPQAPDYSFLAEMAANLYGLGVRWVRLEFHAEEGGSSGVIDYRKYDWFINVACPRFGLKVLALLGVDILRGPNSKAQDLDAIDALDRHQAFVNAFVSRAVEIAAHYGDRLHAYEILNEPNKFSGIAIETAGAKDEINPDAVGNLLSTVFPRLEAVRNVPVVLGGLLTGISRTTGRDANGYLTAVYQSPAAQAFRGAQNRWPFDAVGLHPYRDNDNAASTPIEVLGKLEAIHGVMQGHGDPGTIWVTEIGMQGGMPPGGGPSETEIKQANFLNGVYAGALGTLPAIVERVFWFKYEDIWIGRDETWGVVRLATRGPGDIDPSGAIAHKRPAYDVYSALTPAPPPLEVQPPLAPANLAVTMRTGGAIRFTWQAAIPTTFKVAAHQLFRSPQPDMSNALNVATISQHLFLTGVARRGTNYYALRAIDSAVPPNVSPFSNIVKVTRLL